MKCAGCGAQTQAQVESCPFCGRATELAAHREQQRVQQEAYQASLKAYRDHELELHRFSESVVSLERTAKHSLYWGLGGMLVCCSFIPSGVALVLGLKARRLAREQQAAVPLKATIGIVLGAVGVVLGGLVLFLGWTSERERSMRLEQLSQELQGRRAVVPLAQDVACLLTEEQILSEGLRGTKRVDELKCDSALKNEGNVGGVLLAELPGVRVKASGKWSDVSVCLEKGERWFVKGFRFEVGCREPDDTLPPEKSKN